MVGLATLLALLYGFRLGRGSLARLGEAPWFTNLGGVLGVIIVLTVVLSMQRLGVATATTAILVGQLLAAAAIDHFGLFGVKAIPFGTFKLVGLALFGVGARILLN
jgi:transporter family-2 protein